MLLNDLKGQEALVRTLTNSIQSNRIAQAFLLTGIRGVGKTTTARIIARSLNCIGIDGQSNPTITPCGQCTHCLSIQEDRHPDILEMDAASRTGVNDIREIIENARYLPVMARYKIFIIDEVHMLSNNAFNALLKTLEEPPSHVKFIFATTELRKIPVTIISRCQRFDLKRLSMQDLFEHLSEVARKEKIDFEKEALELLAASAEGSVRDGLSLLDQAISFSHQNDNHLITKTQVKAMLGVADYAQMVTLLSAILEGNIHVALEHLRQFYQGGIDPIQLLEQLLSATHQLSLLVIEPTSLPTVHAEELTSLLPLVSIPALTRLWQMLLKGLQEARIAPDTRMAAEMILIRIAYASTLPTPAELLQHSPGGKSSIAASKHTVSAQNVTSPPPKASPTLSQQAQSSVSSSPNALIPVENTLASTHLTVPASFIELIGLFEKNKELLLCHHLTEDIHLVEYQPGILRFVPTTYVPNDFIERLRSLLNHWTNISWKIIAEAAHSERQETLKTQKTQQLEQEKQEVSQYPIVKAILTDFPEAKIQTIKEFAHSE